MVSTQANWTQLRREFPALKQFTYLDTASFGQMPRLASQAMLDHLAHRDDTASAQFLSWFNDMDDVRQACAQLLNCKGSDIAFVPSASTALSYLIQGLDWKPGDEVLTLEGEFPNQLYQNAALARFGVTLKFATWPAFYSSINERTRLVLLSTVNYATGFRPPLEEISKLLRERKILLYIDGTQSVGALAIGTKAMKASMLAVNAYKWMMSPNGAGFVFIDEALREQLIPTVVGWRSDAGWRQVGALNHGTPVFANSAEKFEGGMIPFPSLYAMGAVLRMLHDSGMEVIENRVLELAAKTRAMLLNLGAEVNTDISQIVTARFQNRDSAEIAAKLRSDKIMISARHGRLRISSHFYNNEDDIDHLRQALS